METNSISGSSSLMNAGQTQQTLATTMMKKAADQQKEMANMLAQNAKQAPQPAAQDGYSFSTYA
jgi:hypothetical protein